MFTSTKALARSPMRAERSQSLRGAATIPHAITRSIIAPYSGCVGWNMLSSYDGCGGGWRRFRAAEALQHVEAGRAHQVSSCNSPEAREAKGGRAEQRSSDSK